MIQIKPDRIRDVIGPGGKVIRGIQEATSTKIDIEDTGLVTIFSPDTAALERAEAMVNELTQEAELDRVYLGKVKRITDFGAFVEIFPGTDGLIHISHLAEGRVEKVTDVVSEGDEVLAKCIDIDPVGPDPALAQGGAGRRRARSGAVSAERMARRRRQRATCAIARLRGAEDLPLPARATSGSAGFDLHAAVDARARASSRARARSCRPGSHRGAAPGYEAQVRPRSGLALRHGHRAAERARHDRLRLPRRDPGDRAERGPRAVHGAPRRPHRAARDRARGARRVVRGRGARRHRARRRRLRPHRHARARSGGA